MFRTFRLAADAKRALKLFTRSEFASQKTLQGKVDLALELLSACRTSRAASNLKVASLEAQRDAAIDELRAANAKLDRMTGNLVQNRGKRAA